MGSSARPPVRSWCGAGVRYDPVRQVLVDETGRPYLQDDGDGDAPSAESVSDYDGDEGKSEDWKYDFAPDHPFVP